VSKHEAEKEALMSAYEKEYLAMLQAFPDITAFLLATKGERIGYAIYLAGSFHGLQVGVNGMKSIEPFVKEILSDIK